MSNIPAATAHALSHPFSIHEMNDLISRQLNGVLTQIGPGEVAVKGFLTKDDKGHFILADAPNAYKNSLSLNFGKKENNEPLNFPDLLDGSCPQVIVYGRPKLVSSTRVFFPHFVPRAFDYADKDDDLHLAPSKTLSEMINKSSLKTYKTRFIPVPIRTCGIIVTNAEDSPIPTDINANIPSEIHKDIEINFINTVMTDPQAIVKSIKQAENFDVLFIAMGGTQVEAFSDIRVCEALNNTPEKQYRILALGHSPNIPTSYNFCDYRTQTPLEGAQALVEIIKRSYDYKNAKEIQNQNQEILSAQQAQQAQQLQQLQQLQQKLQQLQQQKSEPANTSTQTKPQKFSATTFLIGLIIGVAAGLILTILL